MSVLRPRSRNSYVGSCGCIQVLRLVYSMSPSPGQEIRVHRSVLAYEQMRGNLPYRTTHGAPK
jgi:hypothetical protein